MLMYEYRVRDEMARIKEYAENVRTKFQRSADLEDLLLDAKNLGSLYESLRQILPDEIRDRSGFLRHVAWMEKRLSERRPIFATETSLTSATVNFLASRKRFENGARSQITSARNLWKPYRTYSFSGNSNRPSGRHSCF